jgi:ATP-dependent RNA helicase DDX54/DBP10
LEQHLEQHACRRPSCNHRCGRAARAGRPGSALSLLTREELPYLLDLHLFLGRQAGPAPLTPDTAQVEAAGAAMAAAGGIVAAAAAAAASAGGGGGGASAAAAHASLSLYGSFPSLLLDPLIEGVRDVVAAKQDLGGMGRSLANAYALYLKTRPAGVMVEG